MKKDKKVNRNDPCWCGTEKKYKQCHLEHDERLNTLYHEGYPIPSRRLIKTKDQIEGIKRSCALTKTILDQLDNMIKPGVSTNEINDWVHDYTITHHAIPAPLNYKGFPKSICTSINEVVCHGIPSDTILKDGDIVNVDVTCILDGFYGDSCRMYEVGKVSKSAKKLIQVTQECLTKSIAAIEPFTSINCIGNAIQQHAHHNGYGVVYMFGGHGVGNEFHEDPFVYHNQQDEKLMIMVPGMVFTIEPMINEGSPDCEILEDNWTAVTVDRKLSAQWEHTVLITDTGVDILT